MVNNPSRYRDSTRCRIFCQHRRYACVFIRHRIVAEARLSQVQIRFALVAHLTHCLRRASRCSIVERYFYDFSLTFAVPEMASRNLQACCLPTFGAYLVRLASYLSRLPRGYKLRIYLALMFQYRVYRFVISLSFCIFCVHSSTYLSLFILNA